MNLNTYFILIILSLLISRHGHSQNNYISEDAKKLLGTKIDLNVEVETESCQVFYFVSYNSSDKKMLIRLNHKKMLAYDRPTTSYLNSTKRCHFNFELGYNPKLQARIIETKHILHSYFQIEAPTKPYPPPVRMYADFSALTTWDDQVLVANGTGSDSNFSDDILRQEKISSWSPCGLTQANFDIKLVSRARHISGNGQANALVQKSEFILEWRECSYLRLIEKISAFTLKLKRHF
jgi:hypothetical protein